MTDEQRKGSGFPIVRICAAIGAIAGLLLQGALLVWAAVVTGGISGTVELLVVGVITLFVAGVGAVIGALAGIIIKALMADRQNRSPPG